MKMTGLRGLLQSAREPKGSPRGRHIVPEQLSPQIPSVTVTTPEPRVTSVAHTPL